jgi:hypothetical protein
MFTTRARCEEGAIRARVVNMARPSATARGL